MVEYSFTKTRSMERFRGVLDNLQASGFTVVYSGGMLCGVYDSEGAGLGVWEYLDDWPWHHDALLYCYR